MSPEVNLYKASRI